MDFLNTLVKDQIFLLFLTVALGSLLGKISVRGVSIGISGTLFVGLFFGAMGGSVDKGFFLFNLIIFITAVGLLAAKDIVRVLKLHGVKFITLGVIAPIISAIITCILVFVYSGEVDSVLIAETHTGAMTSSPGLAAALEATGGNNLVALGHSIGYIPGVISVILFVRLAPKVFRFNVHREIENSSILLDGEKDKSGKIFKRVFSLVIFSLFAIGGMLLGKVRFPLPFIGDIKLGSTGGVLVFSLFAGSILYKKGKFPFDEGVLDVIRAVALAFFLGVVGIQAGGSIVATFKQAGVLLLMIGALGSISPIIAAFLVGRYIYKLDWVVLTGAICGAMTSTPGLGIAIETTGKKEPAAAYGAVYPVALIMVVLCTRVLHKIFG